MKGIAIKNFTPNAKQSAAIRKVVLHYNRLVKARKNEEEAREKASESAHHARSLGVPRQTLIQEIDSVGAVGNLLRPRSNKKDTE